MALFKINGTIIPQPAEAEYSEEDLSSDSSGRALDGTAHKDIVAIKAKWTLSWPPLSGSEVSTLLTAVRAAVFFTLEYPDPVSGNQKTGTFYVGPRKSKLNWKLSNNALWTGIALNFIEQ